jgi:vacuolar-type H+-ATPase subunit F/Vma7
LPFEKRFEATAKNLAESIRRSQETRKSLMLEIPEMSKYERKHSLSGVLKSVEKSTHQLEVYLARDW